MRSSSPPVTDTIERVDDVRRGAGSCTRRGLSGGAGRGEGAGEEVPRSLPEAAGEAEVVVVELPRLRVEEDAQEAAEVAEEQPT